MTEDIDELLAPLALEPKNVTVSIPFTESERERYRDVARRLQRVTKRHVLPGIARKAVLETLEKLEAWVEEKGA